MNDTRDGVSFETRLESLELMRGPMVKVTCADRENIPVTLPVFREIPTWIESGKFSTFSTSRRDRYKNGIRIPCSKNDD